MKTALSIKNVDKTYRDGTRRVHATCDLSLEVPAGKIYGLLGPNGAGKSTLISMITGSLTPDTGSIHLFGTDILRDPQAAKQILGIVPQELVYEPAFTVGEVLHYYGGMNGIPRRDRAQRIDEVLESLGLLEKRDAKARTLSGGQQRRLMIAKAILHKPKFLILDEPTAGVDVALRSQIWDLVKKLNAAGTTILFTTHYLEEAEQLCEEISFIQAGKIIKTGRTADIQKEFSSGAIYFELFDDKKKTIPGAKKVGSEWEIAADDIGSGLAQLSKHYGTSLKSVRSGSASLEKVFLELNA